ncbi:hypothetical protein [Halosimplex pelagicum]|uniref:Uncharacterized protein n=1 Tax=Halosimplex pelagicum TaxID=869886 RepID=A0A7D5TIC8_9EURY|nr:hypothetical protein [Halosimplex pelagicum]QLH83776.1 hypothetical protein HZS54_20030 [Halosimplex pelagicum]
MELCRTCPAKAATAATARKSNPTTAAIAARENNGSTKKLELTFTVVPRVAQTIFRKITELELSGNTRGLLETMSEPPDVPGGFDTEEELKQYINQLYDQIEFLEEGVEESDKEKLELKQELNNIETQASRAGSESGSFSSLLEPLEEVQQRIEEFEQDKIDEMGGGPSEEAKEGFYEAAGWHPDDN